MISPTVAQMGILITIYLQDTPRLFVDETADPLDSASSCQSPDSWLGNALNVVPQDFTVPLGTSFAQAFPSFPATGHNECFPVYDS